MQQHNLMQDYLPVADTAPTNLHAECHLLLPDYANLILPPLVDTVFTTQNSRFKFLQKSAPKPTMHVDDRTDEQIFADIIRTCSLQLTVEEVNIYDKMLGKPVVFPASIRQDTYRVPKTLLDSAVKDLNLSKSQAESLHRDVGTLPDFVDMYDPPVDDNEPLDPELLQLTV